jgi:hypothetical protein
MWFTAAGKAMIFPLHLILGTTIYGELARELLALDAPQKHFSGLCACSISPTQEKVCKILLFIRGHRQGDTRRTVRA